MTYFLLMEKNPLPWDDTEEEIIQVRVARLKRARSYAEATEEARERFPEHTGIEGKILSTV